MKKRKDEGILISWRTCLRIIVCVFVAFLCVRYWDAAANILILLISGLGSILAGMVIAYVLNIPMRFFESKLPGKKGDGTLNRTFSMVLSIVCILAISVFVSVLVFPQLVSAIVKLATSIPNVVDMLANDEFVMSILPADLIAKLQSIDWNQVIGNVVSWLESGVTSSLPQIGSALSQVVMWFVGIVFALWYLAEKNLLGAQCHRLVRNYLGEAAEEKFTRTVGIFDECFSRYVVGQVLEAFIYGTMIALASMVLGLPYPLMLGVLVGVMSLIPMIGAIIGAVLATIVVLAVSWQQAIVFVIVFIVVMLIEGNVFYKRVVASRIGLTGMWPLVGMTIGASLFGIPGAFVGAPLMAVIFRIVRRDLEKREAQSGEVSLLEEGAPPADEALPAVEEALPAEEPSSAE